MTGPAPELRFFRNYNRKIGLAYAVLLLVLVTFLWQQLRRSMADEIESIQGHLQRHHQFLEFVLRSSADEVDSLRMAAGPLVADTRPSSAGCPPAPARWAAAGLRERPGGGFDRDALADRDAGGNLVGQGRMLGRSAAFNCDLTTAIGLDPRLQALAFQRPQAARTRFISVHGFHLVSPWRPSDELPFDRGVLDDPVWHMGQPEQNRDRMKFWGPSFFAGDEAGLLVPVAAPVYDQDRFMGVVSLDMSLDHLHRVNGSFGYPLGSVAVVDADGAVLAHPAVYVDPLSVRSPHRLVHLFSPGLLSSDGLRALPAGAPTAVSDWLVIRRGFKAAPWELVYAVRRTDLWLHLLAERAPAMAAALLGISLMMALIYAVSSREFVAPAARLVEHLLAESRQQPLPVPKVPKAWRPWFEAITQGFRHSVELSTLRNELDIAAAMQQSILPRQWPSDPRYMLWGSTAPAREVGGDFFDHFELADGRRALVVADVSGKGIAAGLYAMVAKTLLRSVATHRLATPAEVAAQVNNGLCVDNDNSTFVTGVHLQYDPVRGELTYVNAGHPPPLLIRAGGACEWLLATGGTAFGVMEDLSYTQRQATLAPGDTLLMYTDGVTEGEDAFSRQFGPERLLALFEGQPPTRAHEAVQRVLDAARRFAGDAEQFDDITCMAVHCSRLGEAA